MYNNNAACCLSYTRIMYVLRYENKQSIKTSVYYNKPTLKI